MNTSAIYISLISGFHKELDINFFCVSIFNKISIMKNIHDTGLKSLRSINSKFYNLIYSEIKIFPCLNQINFLQNQMY